MSEKLTFIFWNKNITWLKGGQEFNYRIQFSPLFGKQHVKVEHLYLVE